MFLTPRDALPTRRFPVVTVLLIAVNVLVYLVGLTASDFTTAAGDALARHDVWVLEFGAVPCEVLGQCANQGAVAAHEPALTLLTSMFIHGGLLHLVANLLVLWVFAPNVEDAMHPLGFAAFYMLAGIAAGIAQSLFTSGSAVPMVGASGAIAAVIGGYLILYPRARVLWMPVWLVAGAWGGLQFIATWRSVFSDAALAGGSAYMAHLTGFVVGAATVTLLADRRNPAYEQQYGSRKDDA